MQIELKFNLIWTKFKLNFIELNSNSIAKKWDAIVKNVFKICSSI